MRLRDQKCFRDIPIEFDADLDETSLIVLIPSHDLLHFFFSPFGRRVASHDLYAACLCTVASLPFTSL